MNEDFIPTSWEVMPNIITVIGVGGGGCNAVSYMFKQGIKHVDYAVCNTDMQSLKDSPVPRKIQLGKILTKGLGAGMDYLVGQKAAIESMDDIEGLFSENTQMAFITCGMGGGTGTGAAPVIASAARKRGLLTVGVVTIPFRDEGMDAIVRASKGIKEMSKYTDSILIIDNAKLYELYANMDLYTAFPMADTVLATAVRSIADIITCHGFINADFNDVRKTMSNSGVALMGIGTASGEDRARKVVEMALVSPLLNKLDLTRTKNMLVNITTSNEEGKCLRMEEMSTIIDTIKAKTNDRVSPKRGIVYNNDLGDSISLTIIATGFDMAQLPEIDESIINGENIIEVQNTGVDRIMSYKKGLPLCPKSDININGLKMRVKGVPSLITEDISMISKLEKEPAYLRREKIIISQKEQ